MSRFLLATFLISVLGCESGRPIAGADISAADRTEIASTADAFPIGYAHRGRAG